jgi:RNA recognition motif-containing protein
VLKDKKELQKMYNNLYVKNFPAEYTEQQLRQIFAAYGDILSVFVGSNEHGAFAFVCYGKDGAPRDYGYNCAQRAVKELHGQRIDETH